MASPILSYLRAGRDESIVLDTTTTLGVAALSSRTITLVGTLTAVGVVILPAADGADYLVENATTGGFAVQVLANEDDPGVFIAVGERRHVVMVDGAIVALTAPVTSKGYGTIAAMPAAGVAGRRYTAHDGACVEWVDDGSEWRPVVGGVLGYRPPLAATFTERNAGDQTLVDSYGALVLTGAADAAVTWRGFDNAVMGTGLEATFDCLGAGAASQLTEVGLYVRESSTEKLSAYVWSFDHTTNSIRLFEDYYSAYATRATRTERSANLTGLGPLFLKVQYTGGYVVGSVSNDRHTWKILAATSPGYTPNKCGLFASGYNATPIAVIRHIKAV